MNIVNTNLMNAGDAKQKSKDNLRFRVEEQLQEVADYIFNATVRGEFFIVINNLFTENVDRLKDLGYDVTYRDNNLTETWRISWE